MRTTWRGADSTRGGSLACLVDKNQLAYLLWTDDTTLTLGYVRRADDDAATLYEWWTKAEFVTP